MFDDVWFGVHTTLEECNFDDVKELAIEIEEQGFDLLTVIDHFMNPWDIKKKEPSPIECWTTLAALAAVTKRIKLGPLVSCYAYRRPTVLAKMATTIDIISKGRLIHGLGAGWHEPEYKAYMGRYPSLRERFQGLEETLEICKSMFSNEWTTYEGKIYQVEKALNLPPPIQQPIPIMIGGSGEKRTFRLVAKYADISHFFPWKGVDNIDHKLSVIKNHCDKVGRDFNEIRKGVGFSLSIASSVKEAMEKTKVSAEKFGRSLDDTLKDPTHLWGTPSSVASVVQEYLDKGIELVTFTLTPDPTMEDIHLLAEEVLPELNVK